MRLHQAGQRTSVAQQSILCHLLLLTWVGQVPKLTGFLLHLYMRCAAREGDVWDRMWGA